MDIIRFPRRSFLIVLLVALVDRLLVLASGAVSFHADEAVVGLMARHILAGARPTFFYGQAYMGSLDAWLVALGFQFLGDSVLTIRIVQSILYLLVVALGFLVAWRLSGHATVAWVTGLVLAVPPVNTLLYTTATLGGYNETLLFGGLILLLSYEVTHAHSHTYWRWALLGLVAGLGWWTNGLIVVYALPAALLILYRLSLTVRPPTTSQPRASGSSRHFWIGTAVALIGFILGSAPWWVFDFTHDHAALATYLTSRQSGEFAGIGLPYVPPPQRAIGLVLIGLPALVGMRFPWESAYFALPLGIVVVAIDLFAIYRLLRGHNPLRPGARALVLGMLGLFCLIFVASSFGADPTGRYFLPLLLPLGIVLGTFVASFQPSDAPVSEPETGNRKRETNLLLAYACVALVLVYQAAGQAVAIRSEVGLTTQFDLVSHISNEHDDQLIAFLEEHNLYNGYTNYWVAFRLAFLTNERMLYSAALPYKTSLDYNPADNRYPVYQQAAETADRVAVITTNLPALDEYLISQFETQGLAYEETTIGDFHIFYNFAPHMPHPSLMTLPYS
jgi:4-amino-4-deoxy-L-arabinose transferase-like glycosyltransferase